MPQIFLKPPAPLQHCIEALWYWESAVRPHAVERIMPTGTANLIINLDEDEVRDYQPCGLIARHRGAVLVGTRSEYSIIDTEEQRAVMGVAFRPGGAWPVLGIAADELKNCHVGLEDLWGTVGRSLRDRILSAATPEARLQILAASLTSQLSERLRPHPAVSCAVQRLHCAQQLETVEQLSRRVGLSTRRLARLFSLEVGLTPKLYARVLRFNRVLAATCGNTQVDWSDIAYRCGYFDQAHFIRDFKAFSGLTPSDYLLRRTGFTNHVRL